MDVKDKLLEPKETLLEPKETLLEPKEALLEPEETLFEPKSALLTPEAALLTPEEKYAEATLKYNCKRPSGAVGYTVCDELPYTTISCRKQTKGKLYMQIV